MVHGLLFKWEDSAALKHHCGFCERPLNHPGARASCYGKHSEPCVRYHQAMFMRLRGHTCAYCLTIEEAHHKRHFDIAEKIRCVYESCGEVDWTIIPCFAHERGRPREPGDHRAVNKDSDLSPTLDDTPTSRREKKNAKSLARAANRSRVITQDEILYVGDVLHPADGACDSDSPRNPEEVDEIERHLRYHAHVYNTQADRRGLQKFVQFPDADVDFDGTMERILETFRITELIKRNTRNRGLHGRDMKRFELFVEEFKRAVVEDIVLVKKDVLEIRMRRAGYMRYTNKTAVSRVEDRYIDKDWKTGERLASSASDSSGATTPLEEVSATCSTENVPPIPFSLPTAHGPDRRHLENTHTRVSGEDGIYEATIEPYRAPLLPLLPDPAPSQRAISLRVVVGDSPSHAFHSTGAVIEEVCSTKSSQNCWKTVANRSNRALSLRQPLDVMSNHTGRDAHPPSFNIELLDPSLPNDIAYTKAPIEAPSVQAPSHVTVSSASRVPEQFINPDGGFVGKMPYSHPIVSRKKKSKKEREAKRKTKKLMRPEVILPMDTTDVITEVVADKEGDTAVRESILGKYENLDNTKAAVGLSTSEAPCKIKKNIDVGSEPSSDLTIMKQEEIKLPVAPIVTSHGKHLHWLRYTRHLVVDQITPPFMTPWHAPSDGIPNNAAPCAFERNNEPDCPFHSASSDREPACTCCAYRKEMCHLAYPGHEECSFGPLDRLHCERLMAMYEKDRRTRGQLMVVDDVLYDYLHSTMGESYGDCITETMPNALAREYTDFFEKLKGAGPLMQQEHLFQRLAAKNKLMKHTISREVLQKMQLTFEPQKFTYTCYCHAKVTPGVIPEGAIVCSRRGCRDEYFHKACVTKRRIENVSRWYCMPCSLEMKALAQDTLRASSGFDGAAEEQFSCEFQNQIFMDMMRMPDDVFEKVTKRMDAMAVST